MSGRYRGERCYVRAAAVENAADAFGTCLRVHQELFFLLYFYINVYINVCINIYIK